MQQNKKLLINFEVFIISRESAIYCLPLYNPIFNITVDSMSNLTMFGTAVAIASSMIGSVLLILPQVFLEFGLFTCLIMLVPLYTNQDSDFFVYGLHLLPLGHASQKG